MSYMCMPPEKDVVFAAAAASQVIAHEAKEAWTGQWS